MKKINQSEAETLKLIHELEAHQIELEFLNEEITRNQAQTDSERRKYAEFYDFAPTGYFTLSTQGEVLDLNLSASKMLGKDRSHLKNSRFDFHISDDTKPIFNLFLEKIFHSKKVESCELSLITNTNLTTYIHITGIISENEKNCILNVVDITERKQKEQAILESNKKWEAIIDASPDGIGIVSLDGKLQLMSDKLAEMYGYTIEEKDDYIGNSFFDFIDSSNHKVLIDNIKKLIAGEEIHKAREYIAIKKDKSRFYVEINLSVLRDNNGNPTNILYVERDVTGRKRTEDALRSSEEQYRSIMRNVLGVIYRCAADKEWTMQFISEAIEPLTGYPANDFINNALRTYESVIHRDDTSFVDKMVNEGIGGNHPWNIEYRIQHKDGSIRWVHEKGQAVLDDNKATKYLDGFILDITDRKLAEKLMIENNLRLNLALRAGNMAWWEMDVTTGNVTFSKRKTEMLGYTNEKFSHYSDFMALVHPDDYENTMNSMRGHIEGKFDKYEVEYRILTNSGEYIWFYDSGSIISRDSNGKPRIINGLVVDITNRKLAEEKILDLNENLEHLVDERTTQLSETNFNLEKEIENRRMVEVELSNEKRRLADIIKGTNVGTWEWNVQTGETIFNERWAEIIGYTLDEISPVSIKTWMKFAHPDDSKISVELLEKHFKRESPFYSYESRMKHKNGDWVWVFDRGKVHTWDKDGKPLMMSGTRQDFSERKRTENELEQMTTRLALAVRAGGVGVWDFDIVNNVLVWNDQMYALYGINKKDFGGAYEAWQSGLHPDDREQADTEILMAISGEKEFDSEFRVLWPDGTVRNIRAISIVHRDSEGKPLNMIGTNWDITEQKQAEALIKQTRLNYETFFNAIDDFLFVSDTEGNIIHTNATVIRRLGYSIDELNKKSVLFVHPEDRRDEAGRIVGEMLAGTADYCPIPLKTKTGKLIPVETRASHGFWNGKPVIFGVSKDVSKIKLSEEKFSKVFYLNPSACGLSDLASGKYVELNEAFYNLFGFDKNEVIGKTPSELGLLTKETINTIVKKADSNGNIYNAEAALTAKNGEIRQVLLSSENICLEDTTYRFTVVHDITELKLAEEEIIKARLEADKANHAKSEFLSRMSHELRTPMNSILGFAQLMQMGELDRLQKKGVNQILNSGNHLLKLINDVLDLSRIEAGRVLVSPEPVQLSNVILEMLDVVNHLAAKRSLKTELTSSFANSRFVLGDRQLIKQVLLNLMNNAVKYNREGGSVSIKTELMPINSEGIVPVRISISDTGEGISSEDIQKLFIPFERIGAEKTKTEGTGLGLSVVKKLMDAMGGTIGVESVPGEGSTFWIELPLNEDQNDKDENTGDNIEIASEQNYKSGTILYIEDDLANVVLIEQIFASQRPNMHLVTDIHGRQAVNLAIEFSVGLILLDINLPDIQGSAVIELLQSNEKTKTIPIVIISADAMPHQIEKILKTGVCEYLTKPLDVAKFLWMVDGLFKHIET